MQGLQSNLNKMIDVMIAMTQKLNANYESLIKHDSIMLSKIAELHNKPVNDIKPSVEKWIFEIERDYRDLSTRIIAERKDGN